jgi:hypothetical protein
MDEKKKRKKERWEMTDLARYSPSRCSPLFHTHTPLPSFTDPTLQCSLPLGVKSIIAVNRFTRALKNIEKSALKNQ